MHDLHSIQKGQIAMKDTLVKIGAAMGDFDSESLVHEDSVPANVGAEQLIRTAECS